MLFGLSKFIVIRGCQSVREEISHLHKFTIPDTLGSNLSQVKHYQCHSYMIEKSWVVEVNHHWCLCLSWLTHD